MQTPDLEIAHPSPPTSGAIVKVNPTGVQGNGLALEEFDANLIKYKFLFQGELIFWSELIEKIPKSVVVKDDVTLLTENILFSFAFDNEGIFTLRLAKIKSNLMSYFIWKSSR